MQLILLNKKTMSTINFSKFSFILFCLISSACYSFKGISIDPNTKTFYVQLFENTSRTIVPTLAQDFTQSLRDKIRNESRLNPTDTDPDIEFIGNITGYRVSSVAPQANETTAFNRLEISVDIDFINHQDEEKNWKQTFRFFNDFESTQNLLDVQDQLIRNISDQLVEDIFNKAFTNW